MSKKDQFSRTRAWLIWLISNLVVIFSNMQIIYTFISVDLEKELELTITQVALANSVYTWTFAVLQFFSGAMFNIFSIRKIYFFSISAMILGFILLIHGNHFIYLLLSQILIAVGASFGFVGAAYVSSVCFPITQFGLAFSLMFSLVQTIASLSALVIQISFSSLLAVGMYWKDLIIYIMLFGAVTLLLTALHTNAFLDKRSKRYTMKASIKTVTYSMLIVLKLKDIWITAMVGATTFGTFLALNTLWIPRLLGDAGLSSSQLGIATGILWLGLAIGAPISDQISKLFKNRKHVISAFALLQGISIVALLYVHLTAYVVYFCMLVFGFAAGGHMLNFTVGSEIVKQKYISTSSSIINGFMFIAGGIIVSILALFTDHKMALFTIFAMLAVVSVLNYTTKETYPEK